MIDHGSRERQRAAIDADPLTFVTGAIQLGQIDNRLVK